MLAVHEEVHQRAGQKGKVDQDAEHMRAVLGEQQGAADEEKSDQDDTRARE
jgi:hypothetical protein